MKVSPGQAASITSLVLLLLFPNFLVLLGYTVNESIFLGIIAALSSGLIAGWSNMEEEQNPPKKEEKTSDVASNNKELTPAKKADIAPAAKDLSKEIHNHSQLIKGVDYEEKFSDRIVEKKTKNPHNLLNKTGANSKKNQRKGVSLLSWLLIKEENSSKKRRR